MLAAFVLSGFSKEVETWPTHQILPDGCVRVLSGGMGYRMAAESGSGTSFPANCPWKKVTCIGIDATSSWNQLGQEQLTGKSN